MALATSLLLVPALRAGTVYVPVTKDEIQGKLYKTKIWVTNSSNIPRRFTTLFLAADSDGTKREGVTPQSLTVPAGGTLLVTNLGPAGKPGLVEVTGAPQLVVTARIDSSAVGGGPSASAHLPVVSSENLLEGGATAYLQGLTRLESGVLSSIGIVNLAHQASQCSVRAFRSNGTQIGGTAIVSVAPLALREFTDAYGLLAETQIADSYFAVSCPEDFSAYATVLDPTSPQTVFVTPSHGLDSALAAPGEPGGTPGTVQFSVPGTFLDAKPGASFTLFDLPVDPKTRYKKAIIEFDLRVGPMTLGPRNFYGVTAFRRTDRTLFVGLIVRDDRDKTIIDLGEEIDEGLIQGGNNGPWRANTTYYVIFEYDTEAERMTFKLFRAGVLVEQLSGRTLHNDIIANGNKLRVDFGMTSVADGAYFPPLGWKYSNLTVTLEPAK
jgi:hypothetical protein